MLNPSVLVVGQRKFFTCNEDGKESVTCNFLSPNRFVLCASREVCSGKQTKPGCPDQDEKPYRVFIHAITGTNLYLQTQHRVEYFDEVYQYQGGVVGFLDGHYYQFDGKGFVTGLRAGLVDQMSLENMKPFSTESVGVIKRFDSASNICTIEASEMGIVQGERFTITKQDREIFLSWNIKQMEYGMPITIFSEDDVLDALRFWYELDRRVPEFLSDRESDTENTLLCTAEDIDACEHMIYRFFRGNDPDANPLVDPNLVRVAVFPILTRIKEAYQCCKTPTETGFPFRSREEFFFFLFFDIMRAFFKPVRVILVRMTQPQIHSLRFLDTYVPSFSGIRTMHLLGKVRIFGKSASRLWNKVRSPHVSSFSLTQSC